MSKYDPLYKWLNGQRAQRISMTFSQIERVLGFALPNSAREYRAWWANDRSGKSHPYCKSWLDAGYKTERVEMAGEVVAFTRI
jgi:hypothetical protein